jgi:protoheme IX farnesyltransferase
MVKDYYRLSKPGIVYGNLLTTLVAYLFASRWHIFVPDFLATIIGLGFVIASACVFNNYIDRDIDRKMERTKERALVSGTISNTSALVFGTILGVIGFALLLLFVNILTAFIALVGFFVYVLAYTFSKRVTLWATEIGSIAGAVPIVVGYTAVTNQFDATALILFLILAFWQMPHFYAIAMRRRDEYAAAEVPVLPIRKGMQITKRWMLFYILAFGLAVFALTYVGRAGYWYLVITEAAALIWFWRCTEDFDAPDETLFGFRGFIVSLIVLLVFCVMLSVAAVLP